MADIAILIDCSCRALKTGRSPARHGEIRTSYNSILSERGEIGKEDERLEILAHESRFVRISRKNYDRYNQQHRYIFWLLMKDSIEYIGTHVLSLQKSMIKLNF